MKRLFFKVDFAKAYYSVNWNFLLEMLKNLNFPEIWVKWIKERISSARVNVFVNGSPIGEFGLERGIR